MTTKTQDRLLIKSLMDLQAAGEITKPYDLTKVGHAASEILDDVADLGALLIGLAKEWEVEKKKSDDEQNIGTMWLLLGFSSAYRHRIEAMVAPVSTAEILFAITEARHLHEVQAPEDEPEQIHNRVLESELERRYPEVNDALDELAPSWEEIHADKRPVDQQNREYRAKILAAYMIAAELTGSLTTPAGHRPAAICA